MKEALEFPALAEKRKGLRWCWTLAVAKGSARMINER